MLTCIIKNDGEENVVKLTYENTYRELKNIPNSEILVADHWFDAISEIKNNYVCLLEADCLVSSGYFSSQLGLLKKNPHFRKIAVMASATAVEQWHNKFYGYSLGNNYSDGVIPNRSNKSSQPYPVQIAYIPGSIIRVGMLRKLLDEQHATNGWEGDLAQLSTLISLGFWKQGDGNRVHINPNATYCTTEKDVNDIGHFSFPSPGGLIDMFHKEAI